MSKRTCVNGHITKDDKALKCAQCGADLPPVPKKSKLPIVIGVVVVLLLCAIVAIINGNKGSQQAKANPTAIAQPTNAPATKATDAPKATEAPKATVAPTKAAATIAKVGERVESAGIALTINKASKAAKIGDFLTAKDGNTYLVIEALIESTGKDESPYNPLYFKVKADDGSEYTSVMLAPEPSLKSGKLTQGDKVKGNVAFEVPATGKGFVVTYEPMVILGGYRPIRVDLGQ